MIPKVILLVEDCQDDAALFQHAMQRAGLTNPIHCVPSGTEAVLYLAGEGEYADRQRYPMPSVMFLDLQVPGVQGFEILASVRRRFTCEQLLIVVLSGSDDPAVVRRASSLRADAFLSKPPQPRNLKHLADQFPSHF